MGGVMNGGLIRRGVGPRGRQGRSKQNNLEKEWRAAAAAAAVGWQQVSMLMCS
jgi:hypothetical protein